MKPFYILFLLLFPAFCFSQTSANINNFLVKESLVKNSKLAVVAADSLDHPMAGIHGNYTFSISGFTQTLNFQDGVATLPLPIDKSTFVYIKHQNDNGTHSKLLYIYKKNGDLTPITISRVFFIIIPLLIVLLAFAFKRFIYMAAILLVILLVFGYSKGLGISTYFETIFDYLKNLNPLAS